MPFSDDGFYLYQPSYVTMVGRASSLIDKESWLLMHLHRKMWALLLFCHRTSREVSCEKQAASLVMP